MTQFLNNEFVVELGNKEHSMAAHRRHQDARSAGADRLSALSKMGAMSVLIGFLLMVCVGAAGSVVAQDADGTAAESPTLNVPSQLPFVDRTQFLNRGVIEYRVPMQRRDGIPVGDAREFADMESIVALLNQTEQKNQDFKVGKGKPHRRKPKKPSDPILAGCIDSVLIAKNGKLVLEEYFADARRDKPHYQMSITKSILAYAIGKAIEQGKIESENDLILKYLPEVDTTQVAQGVERLTIKDLLTMNSGIRIDKTATNRGATPQNQAQRYLSQTKPIPENPTYKYDGSNCELLVHVLYNVSGQTLSEFVGQHLFGPLGIGDFSFGQSASGLDKGAAGMRLRSRDMLKIGLMTAAGGLWEGRRILNSEWVTRATKPHVNFDKPTQYGYYWWSHEADLGDETVRVRSCRGAGGQFIFVVPEKNLVAVFTSYYADNRPIRYFDTLILPAFAAGSERRSAEDETLTKSGLEPK